ncbi:MAG: CHAT domain-containing protein [Caldilinea sp.]
MTTLTLHDFELQIDPGDGVRYTVAVLRSPAGAARGVMTFPFDRSALDMQLAGLEQALLDGSTAGDVELVQHFGAVLFDALIQGDVRTAYDRSRQLTSAADQGLRLKLRILAPELLTVPWEFLFDTRSREFIALSRHTPVMRYLELLLPDPDFAVTPPLRILGVVAAPNDLPPLDVARERRLLEQALRKQLDNGQIDLVWLERATWRDLQDALQQGPWHILHYSGHAFFDARVGEGALVMTDETDAAWLLSATQLGRLLADHRSLRLTVLNACEGARGDEQSPFSSVAATLVQSGLPAAVAMQYAISDAAAAAFADQFYGALADRLPVDAAVSEGRKAVDLAAPGTAEWGTPVLFSRAADGMIWQIITEAERHPERALLRRLLAPLLAILLVVLAIGGALAYPTLEPLWNVWPMTGGFNIAVAEIGVLQPDGSMATSEFGSQISASLYRTLDDAYRQARTSGAFDRDLLIWHDTLGRSDGKNIALGFIQGKNADERISHAAALAHKIKAQMVVYGHLTDATSPESLQLEFYFDGQERAGEPSALWGGYAFGAPLQPAIAYAVNPDSAKLTLAEALNPRSRALFWMTQAMSYGLANLPERGLAILQRVQSTVDDWDADEGKELFYLVLGDLAQKSREFDVAIDALNKALTIKPDFAPALLILGGVYFDRAQLFPYRTQRVPDSLAACFSTANIENASPTLETAVADNEEAIRLLQRAVSVAATQHSQFAPRAHLSLGLAYRGRAALWLQQGSLSEAEAALAAAEDELKRALTAFTSSDDPVYHAWTQVAMGTVARLYAHIAAIRRDQATDADERAAANAEQINWLNTAIDHYDACLALRERTAGNALFQQRVLACSCEPFALEARQVLSSTLEVKP